MKKIFFGLAVLVTSFLSFVKPSHIFAASPDGVGPWADTVVSANQGLTLSGQAVSSVYPLRSDPTAAVGVAENDTTEGHFYSLGYGGQLVLGFDNPISNGVMLVEAPNSGSLDRASIEFSSDGFIWHFAGDVISSGSVAMPRTISCATYVRLTDISHPADFNDQNSDGYHLDGVMASEGTGCGENQDITPTPGPTDVPSSNNGGGNNSGSNNGGGNGGAPICGDLKPGTPTLIAVSYKNATTAILDWTSVPGANHYMISYGLQPGNYIYGVPDTGNVTHFEVGSLAAGVKYYFRVYASNNCQPSDPTSELSGNPTSISGYGVGGGDPTTTLANTGDSTTTLMDITVASLALGSAGYLLKKKFIS